MNGWQKARPEALGNGHRLLRTIKFSSRNLIEESRRI